MFCWVFTRQSCDQKQTRNFCVAYIKFFFFFLLFVKEIINEHRIITSLEFLFLLHSLSILIPYLLIQCTVLTVYKLHIYKILFCQYFHKFIFLTCHKAMSDFQSCLSGKEQKSYFSTNILKAFYYSEGNTERHYMLILTMT